MEIRKYTKEIIPDVIDFEKRLRVQENFWGCEKRVRDFWAWEIDEKYINDVYKSFDSLRF